MSQIINQDTVEVYYKEKDGKPIVMGFAGRRTKPDFYYRFSTRERMTEYLNNWRKNLEARDEQVKKRQQERLAPTTLKKGDVLYGTWGYDQTNVDFYEVISVLGSRMIEIQEVKSRFVDWDGGPNAHSMPCIGEYQGKVMQKIVSNDRVRINSYLSVGKWDGRSVSVTGYGWGH